MLDYWLALYWQAGNQHGQVNNPVWPARNDIQPAECRAILGNMFILERNGAEVHYRLAGTQLCGLYGRELKRETFSNVFVDEDQRSAESWVYRLGLDDYVVLICSLGETAQGHTVNIETLLLPMNHNDMPGERILGITSPCERPEWLGVTPVVHQSIRSVRILRPWETSNARFQPLDIPPAAVDLHTRRRDMNAPAMFSHQEQTFSARGAEFNFTKSRQVKHLRIIDGGLD